jgi:L-ribulokinase
VEHSVTDDFLIGLDYGTESARGVLVNIRTGQAEDSATHAYPHGVMTAALPDGRRLPAFWALQDPMDYLEAARAILTAIGRGRIIRGIGIGFTASSPLPALADGTPLSRLHPGEPHAYVKLWKHGAAQPWADRITAAGGAFLADVGGRLSANSLLARAAEMAEEAPALWQQAARFIEGADWLVWQLTGQEARSGAFAAYKACHRPGAGYPGGIAPGLATKLSEPLRVGNPAGRLSEAWRTATGILGEPVVAVPVIDSHMVMPGAGAVETGTLLGALGTSAVFLLLDDSERPLPAGIEGVAKDGVVPGFWCYEAGQAGFGDTLAWFARAFPRGETLAASLAGYNEAAAGLPPGEGRIVALDWWNGNRVPHGDTLLTGLFAGMTGATTAAHLYRALMEALCFGARSIADHLIAGGAPVERVVLTSGLSLANPFLVQMMADVLARDVIVPQEEQLTAVGGAIHAAVAAGIVAGYDEGARRFGARDFRTYRADRNSGPIYDELYSVYRDLSADPVNRHAMHRLAALGATGHSA